MTRARMTPTERLHLSRLTEARDAAYRKWQRSRFTDANAEAAYRAAFAHAQDAMAGRLRPDHIFRAR